MKAKDVKEILVHSGVNYLYHVNTIATSLSYIKSYSWMGLFLLFSIPSVILSVSAPILHCFKYYSFIITPNIWVGQTL